ncbi:unnamed protein product [Caenorhabditis bovis]|uniref:BTB domain-containing protein n=1 Tax=Caenorhabditis bovis TaxID=2654633 RepID=A0A8S1FA12_9PELO|nr:unnamed protein product [Caenorhabditis bovis]
MEDEDNAPRNRGSLLPFGDEDHEFVLKFFPNGKDEDTSSYLSLFLMIEKCPQPRLQFRVSFTIETMDGPRSCALNKNLVTINRSGIVTASKFFSIDVLKNCASNYLPNDTLTIGVDLVIYGESISYTTIIDTPPIRRKVLKRKESDDASSSSSCGHDSHIDISRYNTEPFTSFLESGYLTDFTIISSDNREFPVHLTVLAQRCPYFKAMISNRMENKEMTEKMVKFEDISGDVLEKVLQYIYDPAISIADFRNLEEIMLAADRLMLEPLKSECAALLGKNVNIFNVLRRLEFADLIGDSAFFERLLSFFLIHKKECMETDVWKEYKTKNPELLATILEEAIKLYEQLRLPRENLPPTIQALFQN